MIRIYSVWSFTHGQFSLTHSGKNVMERWYVCLLIAQHRSDIFICCFFLLGKHKNLFFPQISYVCSPVFLKQKLKLRPKQADWNPHTAPPHTNTHTYIRRRSFRSNTFIGYSVVISVDGAGQVPAPHTHTLQDSYIHHEFAIWARHQPYFVTPHRTSESCGKASFLLTPKVGDESQSEVSLWTKFGCSLKGQLACVTSTNPTGKSKTTHT